MRMPRGVLKTQLSRLMYSGRRYRLDELHRLTGADNHMNRISFRDKMRQFADTYPYKDGWYEIESIEIQYSPLGLKAKKLLAKGKKLVNWW